MTKIMMVAKKRQRFGRNVLLEGEEFAATQNEARLLLALDLATRVPTPPQQETRGTYRRRDMTPQKREPRRRRKQERIVH